VMLERGDHRGRVKVDMQGRLRRRAYQEVEEMGTRALRLK
jgi:hypothetical protein